MRGGGGKRRRGWRARGQVGGRGEVEWERDVRRAGDERREVGEGQRGGKKKKKEVGKWGWGRGEGGGRGGGDGSWG